MKIYKDNGYADIPLTTDCGIANEEIEDFIAFLNSGKNFSMNDLRNQALLYANKYHFNIDQFWKYIQQRRNIWSGNILNKG